jgi:hypothetical protein
MKISEIIMIKIATIVLALLVWTLDAVADELDLETFGHKYFEARLATQQPGATAEALEAYLALLSENVGYEHKPYQLLGDLEGGKERMREGMTYYLGKNERYEARLVSISTGHNAIAIQYEGVHEYRRGGEGPVISKQFNAMDVLEIEDGEVAIIREYRK